MSDTSQAEKLAAFRKVWIHEANALRAQVAEKTGKPDALKSGVKYIERTLDSGSGLERAGLGAVANLIPGGMLAFLGVAAAAKALVTLKPDDPEVVALCEAADRSERLLLASQIGIEGNDRENAEALQDHIKSWLVPQLKERLQNLEAACSDPQTAKLAVSRRDLYREALQELRAFGTFLEIARTQHWQSLRSRGAAYDKYRQSVLQEFDQKAGSIQSAKAALLIDVSEAERRLASVQAELNKHGCETCGSIKLPGLRFCHEHNCSEDGCNGEREVDSSYCQFHKGRIGTARSDLWDAMRAK